LARCTSRRRDCGETAAITGLIGRNSKAIAADPESVSGVSSRRSVVA
jgi:hypothetical protein